MSDKNILLAETSNRIEIGRNLAVVLQIFALIVIVTLVFIPGAMSTRVKVWSVTASGVSFIAILVGLIVVRTDSSSILYFSFLSYLTTGIFLGYSIFAADKLLP